MKLNPFLASIFLSLGLSMGISGLYAQTSDPVVIPQEVKVDRNGKEPAIPFEQQFRLDTILVDNEYNIFPGPPCLDGNYYVGFQLYYDLGDLNTTVQWAMDLEISLLQGDTPLWTKPLHVAMENQTFIATVFHDQPLSCDGDYYVKIAQKDTTGAAPEQHLFLKALLFREFDAVFNPDTVLNLGYNFYDPLVEVLLDYTGEGVIAYDIEWTYISNHDGFTGNTVVEAFDFKEPVRVTTAASYYKHPLFYPEGRVWFRARAVGYNPAYPDHRINGKWFYGPETAITVSNQQPALNWQLQKSFAEEGKYKNLITYLDGSLRNRQSITNLSTEALSLVGESYYDYEGRKVLEMLPAPVSDNNLNYKSNLNNFTTNDPLVQQNTSATKKKFHYDNANLENSTVANTSGAGNYYSSANQLPMVNKDYLPEADGFVYTQTEFSRDNTGRVSNQSGVGELFRTDGFNSTRFYYGEAAPVELIRLFGSNVGNASHYKKNFVVDPNKQVSVTYLDQEGRTIATSLAGEVSKNLESLASYDSLSPDLMTIDISEKNKKENGASKTAHKILNATPGTNYTFAYDLAALGADMDSLGCQSCLFDLSITITNPRGKLLNLSGAVGNQSTDSLKYERKNIDAADCITPTTINDISFEILFAEAGDYTIVKTLTPQELSFAEMKSILEQDTTVQQQIQLIRDSYVIDSTQCEICLGCDDAEEVIEETIVEIANLDCDNIMQQIINYYQDLNGNDYEVTQTDIEAHGLYCKYTFCIQNVESDVFEKQVARVENWTAAVSKGYDNLVDIDPFFNVDSLSGSGFKGDMEGKINNLFIANVPYYLPGDEVADGTNEFIGEIQNVTDPANTDYYIKENGELDPVNGKHLLYIDLMGRKPQMSTEEYNAELDKQRWYLYKGFYLEAKRKTKLMIADVITCDSLKKELEINNNLPQKSEDIRAWGEANGVTDSISDEQLDMILANMSFNCDVKFPAADSTAIRSHLENYFNGSINNFFKLILAHDVAVNQNLISINNILQGHNCSLDSVAVVDPMACLQDTTFTIVDNILWPEESLQTMGISEFNSYENNNSVKKSLGQKGLFDNTSIASPEDIAKLKKDYIEQEKRRMEAIKEKLKSGILSKRNEALKISQASGGRENEAMRTSSAVNESTLEEEFDALVLLYNATKGYQWFDNTNWLNSSVPVGDWKGVDTDINGHVISIELNGNRLDGVIPSGLNALTHLKKLDLSKNLIDGVFPTEFYVLTNLEIINLSSNYSFDASVLQTIISLNLPNLRELYLSYINLLNVPSSIENLTSLEILNLAGTNITELPSSLGNMNSLKVLELQENRGLVGEFDGTLLSLTNLEILDLAYTQFSGELPTNLGDLENLKFLNLANNEFYGPIPPSIGDIVNLEYLYIYENSQIFQVSYWNDNTYNSTEGNNLTGSIPVTIGSLIRLKELILSENNLTGSIPPEIGNLKDLTRLNLGFNQLEGTLPPTLGSLPLLEDLLINHNHIEGVIPSSYGDLLNLEELLLNHNDLSGSLPAGWANIDSLRYLYLAFNEFYGPIPELLLDEYTSSWWGVNLNNNKFTFADMSYYIQHYLYGGMFYNQDGGGGLIYSPQDSVDIEKTFVINKGEELTLTTDIDRSVIPNCEYQWFRYVDGINDVPLNEFPSTNGHTVILQNVSSGFTGSYYYKISNPEYWRLVLTSRLQTVEVVDSTKYITVSLCKEFDYSNPTLANFHFELDWNLVIQQCMENLQEEADTLADMAVNRYLEEEISRYYRKQSSQCMEKVSENLKYTYANKEYHYTLYYYDQAGNLVQTVPPKGVAPLSTVQLDNFVPGSGPEPQHTLRTKYHYNSFNSLIAQHTPDSDSSYFWYDRKGQLRLSQNAQQHIDNKYSYTTYDRLGRIITVGEMATEEPLETLLALLDSASFPKATDYALNDITRTHYDLPGINMDFEQENLRSRVSWIEVMETPEDPAPVATYYSYDIHGNVKSILQSVPGMEAKRVDYVYDLVSGNVNYVMYQYGKQDQFLHRYKYDADNRIELVYSSTDAFIWNKDAEYFYYAHGPLARVELGQYNVQGLDYYYTLQGWLKGVNMPHEGDPGGDGIDGFRTGKDEFAFTLGYYQNDYNPIGSQVVTADARDQLWARYEEQYPLPNPTEGDIPGLFNGNISWMITDLPEIGRQQNSPAKSMQAMLYDYDQLNRITAAKSLTAYNPGSGFAQRTNPIEAYDVNYSYDANGNLLTLQRMDEQGALMDDFTYSYYSNSNKLKQTSPVDEDKIYESGAVTADNKVYRNIFLRGSAYVPSGSTVELKAFEKIKMSPDFKVHSGANFKAKIWKEEDGIYQYDAIGNLIADLDEGVKIKWTPYGKVREVQKGDSTTIYYKYDGTGNRIEKSVMNGIDTVITRYIRDASGNVMAIYNDTVMTEQPIYGSSRLGMYRRGDSTGMRSLGYKNYELSNHLGNVLAVVSDNIYMNQDSTMAGVVSTNDYYPFGLGMAGRSWNDSTYRYGFNGKEKDKSFGITNYDYGFRIYNPQIAKFLSVDPLTASYPWNSTYAFAENRVVDGIDLDGLEYLKADEARIEAVYGRVRLKIENFSRPSRGTWKIANMNSKNWPPGRVGINRTVAELSLTNAAISTASEVNTSFINENKAKMARLSTKTSDPNHIETNRELLVEGEKRHSSHRMKGASVSSSGQFHQSAARGTLLLNAVNFGIEQYYFWSGWYDKSLVEEQVSAEILGAAVSDVQKAIKLNMIPEQYQNTKDITNILNVVLQGVNNTDNPEIYDIGINIVKEISENYQEPESSNSREPGREEKSLERFGEY